MWFFQCILLISTPADWSDKSNGISFAACKSDFGIEIGVVFILKILSLVIQTGLSEIFINDQLFTSKCNPVSNFRFNLISGTGKIFETGVKQISVFIIWKDPLISGILAFVSSVLVGIDVAID